MNENCGSCRFWNVDDEEPELGQCRRFPPAPFFKIHDNNTGHPSGFVIDPGEGYPETCFDEWCGEYSCTVAKSLPVPQQE